MVTRPGADDNASGTAAVLELATRLAANPAPRSVLFVHFDAEELGLIGSHKFVAASPIPLDSVLAMVNFDMVGRLRKDDLIIDLPPNARGFRGILDSLAAAGRLRLQFTTEFSDRSDHAPFDQKLVPAFTLFTGLHPDYHTSMDIAVRVSTNGIARIVDLVEQLIRRQRPRA
jgi:Zn-dependent M28 family amino/carboxypeptidase